MFVNKIKKVMSADFIKAEYLKFLIVSDIHVAFDNLEKLLAWCET